MLYGCKRTAQCMSMKYSTLAKLSMQNFKNISLEFPEFQNQLKEGIYKYNDKQKKFLRKHLEYIEYFQDIGEDAIHDIMYNLQGHSFLEGEIIQRSGDDASEMYLL